MQKIYEDVKKMFESKLLLGMFYGVSVFIIAIFIFSAGISIGMHKASFGRALNENYYGNLGMRPPLLDADDLPSAHGALGKIIKTYLPKIIVSDINDKIEKVISIDDDTNIQKGPTSLEASELMVDDFIIVIGEPNEKGVLRARLVRVLPDPGAVE